MSPCTMMVPWTRRWLVSVTNFELSPRQCQYHTAVATETETETEIVHTNANAHTYTALYPLSVYTMSDDAVSRSDMCDCEAAH